MCWYICDSCTDFTCCEDTSRSCIANLTTPNNTSSVFAYDKDADTMLPKTCPDDVKSSECCHVVPWPEGIMHGYPYRLRTREDVDVAVSFSSHV
jgi:hypothetical protein